MKIILLQLFKTEFYKKKENQYNFSFIISNKFTQGDSNFSNHDL